MTPWMVALLPQHSASGMRDRTPGGAGTSLLTSSQGEHTWLVLRSLNKYLPFARLPRESLQRQAGPGRHAGGGVRQMDKAFLDRLLGVDG